MDCQVAKAAPVLRSASQRNLSRLSYLGLRIGYGAEVGGVKPSTCFANFTQPFSAEFYYTFNGPVFCFFDAGDTPVFISYAINGAAFVGTVILSGYMIDIP